MASLPTSCWRRARSSSGLPLRARRAWVLLVQLDLQLGQYGLFEDFRQAVAQCPHGLALLLGAEAGIVLDAQAVEGELVVGLFLGEERLVGFLAEEAGAQRADGLLALANAIQVGQLWQVAFQIDQLALVIEVLLEQLQGLAFGRLRQLRGDITLQAFDAGFEWLFAEAAEEVVEQVANLAFDDQVAAGIDAQAAVDLGALKGRRQRLNRVR